MNDMTTHTAAAHAELLARAQENHTRATFALVAADQYYSQQKTRAARVRVEAARDSLDLAREELEAVEAAW